MSDGLFPTGALSVTATTRDVVTNLRRVPVEDLVSLAESVAAAFLARGPLDSISTAALDASGAASQPAAALLSASIGDAVRSHLPKSAIREWWESAGLDSDRADALASTISAAAPSIAATCEREGIRLPQLVDVKWQLDYAISSQSVGRVGDAVLRVDLTLKVPSGSEPELQHRVFCCSSQELDELIRILKSAATAAQRAAR